MEKIQDTVQIIMRSLEKKKNACAQDDVDAVLNKYLTKKEIGHIKHNHFAKGVLTIVVDSSAWLYQINLKKENLLVGLKEKNNQIKDLRFRLG